MSRRISRTRSTPAMMMSGVGTVMSPSEPGGVVVADDGRRGDARHDHHRRQLTETAHALAPGEGQERRRVVESAEAGHTERELAAVLVPGADQREGDEAPEESDVGRAAVWHEVE